MARATFSRTAHDLGLAAWFGGTLANAVALNAAAGAVSDAKDAGRVANAGWNRWTPVNAVAIGASRVLGRRISDAGAVPLASGTEPTKGTPPEIIDASTKLHTLQWVIPALTGVLVGITSYAGEQQRPSEVSAGLLGRFSRS